MSFPTSSVRSSEIEMLIDSEECQALPLAVHIKNVVWQIVENKYEWQQGIRNDVHILPKEVYLQE